MHQQHCTVTTVLPPLISLLELLLGMDGLQVVLHGGLVTEHSVADGALGLPAVDRPVMTERRRGEELPTAYLTPLARIERFIWKWKKSLSE